MDFARQERRASRIAALTCVVAVCLSSCAHRTVTPIVAARTTPTAPEATHTDQRKPPAPRERTASLRTIPSRGQPTRTEQIIALVRGGELVNESQGALVFSKSGLTRSSRSGLYEDAILLARLRRTLQETAGIPESVSAKATVREARAYLSVEDTLPAATAASAVDAGLRTPGIIAVQVRIGG